VTLNYLFTDLKYLSCLQVSVGVVLLPGGPFSFYGTGGAYSPLTPHGIVLVGMALVLLDSTSPAGIPEVAGVNALKEHCQVWLCDFFGSGLNLGPHDC
jgi:hypothetical protein